MGANPTPATNPKNAYLLTRAARDIDEHIRMLELTLGVQRPTDAMLGYMEGLRACAGMLRDRAAEQRGDR